MKTNRVLNGPDGFQSWLIAGACCFINMMMFGMSRLSGVLFIASMPRFGVNREDASFAYTFANFTRNLSGPLVGYIGHKFGVRNVTTFGGLLAAVGVGACFFAESINSITILWGFVFGFGFGLGNILLPVKINQYFDYHRATASGIAFSGACLGSFILPPVVEILLNTFGLSGTFLILSGLVLNCVPAALLLRKPDFIIQNSSRFKGSQNKMDEEESRSITSGKKVKLYTVDESINDKLQKKFAYTASKSPSFKRKINDSNGNTQNVAILSHEERMKRLSTQTLLSNYSIRMNQLDVLNSKHILESSKGPRQVDHDLVQTEVGDKNLNYATQANTITTNNEKSFADNNSFPPYSSGTSLSHFNECVSSSQNSKSLNELYCNQGYQRGSETLQKDFPKNNLIVDSNGKQSMLVSILLDPIFLLVALTNALYCFTFVCMVTVIVDFARDIGVGSSNEKYILMSLSVGDLIGRLGLGWITDRGYMTRIGFAAFCFMFQGIITTAIVWASSFYNLLILSALYGLSEAGIILIFPLIIAQYIEEEKQTVAISSIHFLAGPLCLTVSPLIGFFRDEGGSYDYIFFGIGLVSAFCCIAWLIAPWIVKCKKKLNTSRKR